MNIKVRLASLDDLDWLASQSKLFCEFFGTKRSLFKDEAHTRACLKNTIENHILFVAERTDVGLVGFIGGIVMPHIFNPDITCLIETYWWVAEEYRGTRAGLMLLNEFVEYGKAHTDWVLMTLESGSPVSDRCLLKRGFQLKEQNYLLEVG